MISLLVTFASFFVGFFVGRWRQTLSENQGEAAVRRLLATQFSSTAYHLLNNVTLPVKDGTTQIDHILVTRFGIFVIETKHYTGWLFANPSSPNWTQVIYKRHFKFQNPLHQNRKHVKAVEKLLDFIPPEHIQSVVVFTGDATFKTPRPEGVRTLSELASHIKSHQTEVLSENRLQFCVGRLEFCRKALTQQTDVEHVAHLRRKFGDVP
ncbi:MAG: nuclease-related domain-containing protein [Thiobacillus sp.]